MTHREASIAHQSLVAKIKAYVWHKQFLCKANAKSWNPTAERKAVLDKVIKHVMPVPSMSLLQVAKRIVYLEQYLMVILPSEQSSSYLSSVANLNTVLLEAKTIIKDLITNPGETHSQLFDGNQNSTRISF